MADHPCEPGDVIPQLIPGVEFKMMGTDLSALLAPDGSPLENPPTQEQVDQAVQECLNKAGEPSLNDKVDALLALQADPQNADALAVVSRVSKPEIKRMVP